MAGRLWLAGVLLAGAAAAGLAIVPSGVSTSTTTLPGGGSETMTERRTLLETEGWGVVPLLAGPPALLALAWAVPRRARRTAMTVSAVLVGGFAVLGAASIGLFYAPAAAFASASVVASGRRRAR